MAKNVEMKGYGLKCDEPDCDYINTDIKLEDYKDWVNAPCPKCGANLLTEANFAAIEFMQSMVDIVNMLPTEEGPRATMRVETDPSGNIKLGDIKIKSDQ